MKNLLFTFIVFIFMSVNGATNSSAQCSDFADSIVLPLLDDYIVSGRYAQQVVSEGQSVEVRRTLSKGIRYRFAAKGDQNLPQDIEITVETDDRKQLYASKDHNFSPIWDFECKETVQVVIFVSVPNVSPLGERPKAGCVSLLSGIKPLK